jgi:acyl-homoserine-lactone acylase
MGAKKALAIKAAGMNNPDALLEWWKMAGSHNFIEFESALKMMQIPFWNVLYADKQGTGFYLFNGDVPRRKYGTYFDWNRVIASTSSKDIWNGYLTYDELPKLKNPKSGWLQNTNDPPWTVTFPRELTRDKYPAYIAPEQIDLRTERSMNMLIGDSAITFDHLVDYKLSTHVEMADRVLPDLLSAIDSTSSPILQEAKQVLSKWDRKADNDSRGMVLFYLWAMPFMPKNDYNYAVGWDAAHPNTTPYGIRDKQRALDLLEKQAKLIKSAGADLSVPWGAY